MKFTKQDLLTLLIGLFLFAGCKSGNNVGLDVDSNTAIQGDLVDNQAVTTRTIKSEDISTVGLTRFPLGYMDDPIFGKTESSLALSFSPPSLSYDFGAPTAQLDSVVLVLRLDSINPTYSLLEKTKFYGDTVNSVYSIDVHQLTNPVTVLKSNAPQAYENVLLGNFTGKIKPNTPAKITNVVTGKPDTSKFVKPQLRIKLDRQFFQDKFVSQPAARSSSMDVFTAYFKGLSLTINKASSSGVGGIAFIKLDGGNSYLQFVYHKQNTNATIDTVSVNYTVASASTPLITHDYAGTDVQTQLDNPTTAYNVTYAQGLVGVKTMIAFPDLKNFKSVYGKVVVNKAELVVPASAGSTGYPFGPLSRLSLYRSDIAGQPAQVSDHSGTSGDPRNLDDFTFGGYYDALQNRYVFTVTGYVQDLIDGKLIDYGTFLAPSAVDQFQITPSASVAGRTVINSSTDPSNKLKLNIYYTKIN